MAELIDDTTVVVPDQNVDGKAQISGFDTAVFKQTYLCREKIKPLIAETKPKDFDPTIYKIDLTDIKNWISPAVIKRKTMGWQYWFPMEAEIEMTDLQCVDVQEAEKIAKDVDHISINTKVISGSRAYLTPQYCYDHDNIVDKRIDNMANFRNSSAQNIYSSGVLPIFSIKNFGILHKSTDKQGRKTLPLSYKGPDWEESFNKLEQHQLSAKFHTDIRFGRHMRELWDETDQEVLVPLVDCKKVKAPDLYTKDWVQYVSENSTVAKRKAYVTYPFDYRSGITTMDCNEYNYNRENANVLDAEIGIKNKMFGAEFKSTMIPVTNPENKKELAQITTMLALDSDEIEKDYSYMPTNVPHPRFPGYRNKRPLLRDPYDQRHCRPGYFASYFAEGNDKNATLYPHDTLRKWPAYAPFTGDKTIKPMYFSFDPKLNEGKDRNMFVTFKLKVTYKIGGYCIYNHLDPKVEEEVAEDRINKLANEVWMDAPIMESVKVCNPITNKTETQFSGFNRMFICKPIMHFYKSAKAEDDMSPCKKICLPEED